MLVLELPVVRTRCDLTHHNNFDTRFTKAAATLSQYLLLLIHIDPARPRWFYMSGDCLECGQNTQWDGELGSCVCAACGTLSNSTQITLASHADSYETTTSGHEGSFAWDLGNPTLKSIRNKDGRALSGQGREVRLRQNIVRALI